MSARAVSKRERREHAEKNVSARGFEICDRVLALTGKLGAAAVVLVSERDSGHVRFGSGEITTAGEVSATTVRLTLAFGRRHAKSETNQTDRASLEALVARAAGLAKLAPDDPEWVTPLGPSQTPNNPQAWDDVARGSSPSLRAAAARTAIARAEEKSLVASGYIESHADTSTLATSTGLRAEGRNTIASMTMTARTRDGTGSGWAGSEVTRAADLDADALARIAVDKAERSRGATKLDPGRYTVVLEPAAVAVLLDYFIEALDCRAADQGRSFFSKRGGGNRIGETIFDPRVTLRSDPFDPLTPGRTWDDDGIPLRATPWIESGVLRNLSTTRFWAKHTNREPTGAHSTFRLSFAGATETPLEGIRRGLLVTRFWYVRWLDRKELRVTGLTRDGVWLIEDGRVTRAVQNFRFNESPARMLTNVVTMSARSSRIPSGEVMRIPTITTNDFEMSSVSDAV